jgi:hypothetical protein
MGVAKPKGLSISRAYTAIARAGTMRGRKGGRGQEVVFVRRTRPSFFLKGVLRVDDDVVKNRGRVKSTKRGRGVCESEGREQGRGKKKREREGCGGEAAADEPTSSRQEGKTCCLL